MRRLSIVAALLLPACSAPITPAPQGHGGGHTPPMQVAQRDLTVEDRSSDVEIAFLIKEGEDVFTDYGVSHTKEMHLIVVRDDLRHFAHLHPEHDASGTWRVAYTAPTGGTYWVYSDFVDRDGAPYTIPFTRTVSGSRGAYGLTKSTVRTTQVNAYRVELQTAQHGMDTSFTYVITDAKGKPAALEEYLGAKGHSVMISPEGDFIHTHPEETEGPPVFTTVLPPGSFYRMFTQFQIEGEVITVSFDWVTSH